MTNLLVATGNGFFKSSNNGVFRVGSSFTDKGGSTLVQVSDIIANNGNDPTNQNYPTATKNTPILFNGATYVYDVDGGDGGIADSTTLGMNTSKSLVEFTPISGGSTFFGNNGDIMRFAINWRNWADSKFQIVFTNKSQYDGTYSRQNNTFTFLQLHGNVIGDAMNMFFGYIDSNNQGQKYGSEVSFVGNSSTLTIGAFNDSSTGNPVLLDIERLNNTQLKVTLRDSNGNEFAGQGTLTCNTPTSDFSTLSDTNDDGIYVSDITHIYTDEVGSSGGSEIDYTIRKI